MSRINKQLNESNSIIYTSAFVETISKVDIPAVFISSQQIVSMINILIQQVTVGYSIIQAAAAMPTFDRIKSATV
jgi:hypothetical protein